MISKDQKNTIDREVSNRTAIFQAWEIRQPHVRFGGAGTYIGRKTELGMAGDWVALYRRGGTSIADFEKEARGIGLLK